MSPADFRLSYRALGFTYPCNGAGRDGTIRTCSLLDPSQVRYQVAPHPAGTDGGTRTPESRLWRPLLYLLSYIRIEPVTSLELATFSLED